MHDRVDVYSGQRAPLGWWGGWLHRGGWRSVRFFGIVAGRCFVGVQVFSKTEVRKRHDEASGSAQPLGLHNQSNACISSPGDDEGTGR